MMNELETLDSMQAALRSGELTSTKLVARCLDRIQQQDQHLRAWVSVDAEGARAAAEKADAERASGCVTGALHGIPIGIKDIVDIAGMVTGAGSKLRVQTERPATRDAAVVASLRRAGAIILGKTVTTQFACFDPPPTRNPRAAERTPGGSSSGSAAAVAAGMVPAAMGSQTGGSITRPASYCGVCGMKPTYGTVPVHGIIPLAASMDHPGPIASSVSDLRSMLQALVETPATVSAVRPMSQLKLVRLRGFFEDRVDPKYVSAIEAAIDQFSSAGATIVDVPVPAEFSDVLIHHRHIIATEAAAWHRERFRLHRNDYGPCIASLIEEGLRISADDYAASKNHQLTLRSAMQALFADSVDALLTPATTGAAPDAATTGDPCMNSPWSFTGFPTVSFPIGFDAERLPLAIQLTGLHHHDWHLLDTAEACESSLRQLQSLR